MVTLTRDAWRVAASVRDPELPMVTVADLGILRDVAIDDRTGKVKVTITPTYSGCPAIAQLRSDLYARLLDAGYRDVEIHTVLHPPWTTDWITPAGKRKLAEAGIAPPSPAGRPSGPVPVQLTTAPHHVSCPQCGSRDTEESSRFGSTACKALWRCRACLEPFERIKEI